MRSTLDWALAYEGFGWSVIPTKANSKEPNAYALRSSGSPGWMQFQQRRATPQQIVTWFEIDPTCGIAIVTGRISGLVVLDFDRGEWPTIDTATALTGRGVHVYLLEKGLIKGYTVPWGEVRGEGQYVVAPPSVHPSAHIYEWLVPPEAGLARFEDVKSLVDLTPTSTAKPSSDSPSVGRTSIKPSEHVPTPQLHEDQRRYLDLHLRQGDRGAAGFGEKEYGIIVSMLNQGYSDSDVLAWFIEHKPPKFQERGMGWLTGSINRAVAAHGLGVAVPLLASSPSSSPSYLYRDTEPIEEWDDQGEVSKRPPGWAGRRWWILCDAPEGVPVAEFENFIKEEHGVARTQAKGDVAWLVENGYLEMARDPTDLRVKIVRRTDKAVARLASRGRGRGVPFDFLMLPVSKRPDVVEEVEAEPTIVPADQPGTSSSLGKPRRKQTAEEKARNAELRRRDRSLINGYHRLYFPGRPVYFALLTAPSDAVSVLLYEQLQVGRDEDGFIVRRSFVSPENEALEGPGAADPIGVRTRTDGGYPPSQKYLAWGVELRLIEDGFEVATRVEDGKEVANVGLVVQAWPGFFSELDRSDVVGRPLQVRAIKSEKFPRYEFAVFTNPLDLDFETPSLEAIRDEMASPDLAAETLRDLPEGWLLVRQYRWWPNDLQQGWADPSENPSGSA